MFIYLQSISPSGKGIFKLNDQRLVKPGSNYSHHVIGLVKLMKTNTENVNQQDYKKFYSCAGFITSLGWSNGR
jgi:hypothetical protein